MQAIHSSPINVHGDLRSSKCLIDNRWVCKIADYGLSLIKANQRRDIETGPHAAYASKYIGTYFNYVSPPKRVKGATLKDHGATFFMNVVY